MLNNVASSAFDFAQVLKPGDTIAWPQGTGEPLGLTRRLVAQRHELPPINIFIGFSSSRTLQPEHADRFTIYGLNGAGTNRRLTRAGAIEIIPTHVSEVPKLLRTRAVPVDVALVRVRPHKASGKLSVGVITDYTRDLIAVARYVVAEIDERMPETSQDAVVPVEAIDAFVTCDCDEILMPDPQPSVVETAVARHVAAFIPDPATFQFGIGALPAAVGLALADHRDLGVHSGVVSDVLVDLVEKGVVTNAYKGRDAGVSVTGGLFGTRRLFDFADGDAALAMRSLDYTHNVAVMAQLNNLYSVNSAIEVDLSGQVNAEQAGGQYLGAIGGQVDTIRGALASAGGRSIIALPATTADGSTSRIVAALSGPVTTARADIDVVVTEFGVAELRGCTLRERAARLRAIAHPDFRDSLSAGKATKMEAGAPQALSA